ncbi:hypothetical protein SPSYN_00682 [Sporotomaculum syntrophicum]|uniref:Uncharacterized protein n=1 Tax=Sporotomaculum syntrophicum TaxID=182264 RepID=A0A9D3AWV5_9FIRM|nr:hypothetical protein SPSYN_00682 [Sporotomaculum syntrophicum]
MGTKINKKNGVALENVKSEPVGRNDSGSDFILF